jgi:uncharacterized protein YnzC (UPF0291/DUF896 family)
MDTELKILIALIMLFAPYFMIKGIVKAIMIKRAVTSIGKKKDWTIYLHENQDSSLIIKLNDLNEEVLRVKYVKRKDKYKGLTKERIEETIFLKGKDLSAVRKVVREAMELTFYDRPGNMEGSNNNIYIIQKK